MFNITGVFTEQGPGSGVHRGAHICLRSSHPSWSSVGFRIFDRSLFLTALFSITPGLHHTWGSYIVMNNLAAESKLGCNSSDTFRENFKLLERGLAFAATWRVKWGTIFLSHFWVSRGEDSQHIGRHDEGHSGSFIPHVLTWQSVKTFIFLNLFLQTAFKNGKLLFFFQPLHLSLLNLVLLVGSRSVQSQLKIEMPLFLRNSPILNER